MNTAEPNINPIIEEHMEPAPIVQGTFYRTFDPGEFLTIDEKRAWLAHIFRSPDFTPADKLKAITQDNHLEQQLAPFTLTTAEITALVFAAAKYIAPHNTFANLRVRDLYSAINKLTALPQSETANPFN